MRSLLLISICFTLLLSSCQIEKRHYRPGYHVSWYERKSQPNAVTETENTCEPTFTASLENEPAIIENETVIFTTPDSCGDMLRKRNGDMLRVKVLEILPGEVKYKRCDNINGPVYTETKREIASIDYSNGMRETFEEPPKEVPVVVAQPDYYKKKEPVKEIKTETAQKYLIIGAVALLMTLGMIAGVVLAIIFDELFLILAGSCALIGLIAGIVDLAIGTKDYKTNRRAGDRSKNFKMTSAGLHMALFSMIFCAIGGIISLAALAIFNL